MSSECPSSRGFLVADADLADRTGLLGANGEGCARVVELRLTTFWMDGKHLKNEECRLSYYLLSLCHFFILPTIFKLKYKDRIFSQFRNKLVLS